MVFVISKVIWPLLLFPVFRNSLLEAFRLRVCWRSWPRRSWFFIFCLGLFLVRALLCLCSIQLRCLPASPRILYFSLRGFLLTGLVLSRFRWKDDENLHICFIRRRGMWIRRHSWTQKCSRTLYQELKNGHAHNWFIIYAVYKWPELLIGTARLQGISVLFSPPVVKTARGSYASIKCFIRK